MVTSPWTKPPLSRRLRKMAFNQQPAAQPRSRLVLVDRWQGQSISTTPGPENATRDLRPDFQTAAQNGSPVGFGPGFLLKHRETRHLATGAFTGARGNWAGLLRKRMGGPPARRAAARSASITDPHPDTPMDRARSRGFPSAGSCARAARCGLCCTNGTIALNFGARSG